MALIHIHISKIIINNFRNYDNKLFDVQDDKKIIIISGKNGSGKTNILEAISLFCAGKGLKKSDTVDLQNVNGLDKPWGVSVELQKDGEVFKFGTGATAQNSNRRLLKVNGEFVRSRNILSEYLSVIWLTPQVDKIFIESKTSRQRFFDKMIVDLFPVSAHSFFEYNKALRQRNKLLKDGNMDDVWLSSLENILIEQGQKIAQIRLLFCSVLNDRILHEHLTGFPQANIEMVGDFEDFLKKDQNEEDFITFFKQEYAKNRITDRQKGRTSIGCHRSDFSVSYIEKNMAAKHCSTGEQKSLLIGIFLSYAKELKEQQSRAPIILLDELIAHLDENKRSSLFRELDLLESQTFMTGTDIHLFEEVIDKSQIIQVK